MLPLRRSARRAPIHRAATRRPVRTLAGAAASALVAATLAVTGALGAAAATPCPPVGDYKNLHNGTSLGSDDNVNVYVGGDLSVAGGGAEAEGLVVVGGDMTISSGYYNLGVAGVGSRVPPAAMSDMLVTGGSVIVSSGTLDVGNSIGGNIVAGGTVTGTHATSGGTVTQNAPSPLAPYAGIPAQITQASAEYAALAPTGGYDSQSWGVTFYGDGVSPVQVFQVPGDQLGTLAAPRGQNFTGIPAGAVIIINVTGSTAVVSSNGTQLEGVGVNPMSTSDFTFSRLTQSILWNFPTAADVTLGKSDQLLGSVLVPSAVSILTVLTSTNGRVLTNGDLVQGGGSEAGLEFHSFPFRGAGGCTIPEGAPTGGFSVSKTLSNPDGVPAVPTDFTIEYSIDGGTAWVPLTVTVGAPATVSGLPAGTRVLLREPAPAAVAGGLWRTPVWSDDDIMIVAGATASVTVTNTLDAVLDPAFSTVAWVDDDGVTKQLPLTGGTVTDRISYSGLTAGTSYRFDGWLMRADGGAGTPIGISQSATFTPTAASGTLTMDWIISSAVAAANAGQRVVIYLELYEVAGAVAPIASDLDIDNPTEWFTLAAAPGTTQRPGPGDPGDPLASTGVDLGGLPGLAALLLGGGALLLGIIRHRRRRTAG